MGSSRGRRCPVQEAAGVFERSGAALRYQMAGPEDGPVVVLGAGRWLDHRMWDPQLPALWQAGYRTLTWDLPSPRQPERRAMRNVLTRREFVRPPDAVPDVSVPVESVPIDHVRTYPTPVVKENLTVRGLAEALLELAEPGSAPTVNSRLSATPSVPRWPRRRRICVRNEWRDWSWSPPAASPFRPGRGRCPGPCRRPGGRGWRDSPSQCGPTPASGTVPPVRPELLRPPRPTPTRRWTVPARRG